MSENHPEEPNELDPEENLRMENKIKRLELELKGAKFLEHNPDGIQLPPEIESQMLDQILQFEKLKNEAKEVEIYEYIGRPRFTSIDELSSEEIILEKERIMNLMSEKGIILSSVEEIDDREMYRFITEEFFCKKTLDVPIKGFIRHFVYEEFYPNDTLNAEKTVELFIQSYLNEENETPIQLLCRQEIHSYLKGFKALYEHFTIHQFSIIQSEVKKIIGRITIELSFDAFIENSLKSHTISGVIEVTVRKRKGFWQISDIQFPKVS